jgi:hypothetical protein
MWFSSWLRTWKRSDLSQRRRVREAPRQRPSLRPRLEVLEERTLLSSSVSALVADINAANQAGGSNTINLTPNTIFDLTAVNNTTNGANGLPVISGGDRKLAADNLTIVGNGDTIQRDTTSGMPAFRLFDVAQGASLTLENVKLQGGFAFGSGAAADGGAIYNQGTLTLSGATVQDNTAQGSDGAPATFTRKNGFMAAGAGADAAGGGIWSSGTVTLQGGSTVQGNGTFGGTGGAAFGPLGAASGGFHGGAGGSGFGGGLYEAGGSASVSNAILAGNSADGGQGGAVSAYSYIGSSGSGGAASGGGLYVAGGTLSMSNDTVNTNQALGGAGGNLTGTVHFSTFNTRFASSGSGGAGSGAGIYVGGATGTLQAVELSSNQARGGDGGATTHFGFGQLRGLGGNGLGGGLYVAGGTLTLTDDTVTGNSARAGVGASGGAGGGGIYIVSQAGSTVYLDSFTVTNATTNYDYDYNPLMRVYVQSVDDIDGSYTLI